MSYETKFENKDRLSSLEDAGTMFNLLGVSESIDDELRIFDSDPERGLYLVHYLSPGKAVRCIRGVIFQYYPDDRSPKMVCRSFPYTEEISYSDAVNNPKLMTENLTFDTENEYTEVTSAEEGTIIRMFYHDGDPFGEPRWFLSTHKKIDGSRSRWAGKPFGLMFSDVWPNWSAEADTLLNRSKCYVFLLSHPDNRLVCPIPKPSLKLVGIYEPDTTAAKLRHVPISLYFNVDNQQTLPFSLSTPMPVSSLKEFMSTASTLSWKETTGLLYTNFSTGVSFKVTPDLYDEYRGIRGNEPNLRLRYLQLESDSRHLLRELFPERTKFFDDIDKNVIMLTDYLVDLYRRRYVNCEYIRIPPEDYYIINRVHQNFIPGKSIAYNIDHQLSTSSPRQINAMINHMTLSKKCPEPDGGVPEKSKTPKRITFSDFTPSFRFRRGSAS